MRPHMRQNSEEQKNTIPRPGIVFLRPFSSTSTTLGQKTSVPEPLAISVSKKIFKTAVLRNKAKRKIREAYRLSVKDMKHDTLHPLPFLRIDAREGVLKMKIEEIQAIIKAQFQK
jgi:ribonuclease P protein component